MISPLSTSKCGKLAHSNLLKLKRAEFRYAAKVPQAVPGPIFDRIPCLGLERLPGLSCHAMP